MQTSSSSSKRFLVGLCLLLCAWCVVQPRVAHGAEESREFQEHYQRAMTLYKLGLFRQSAKEFVVAYALNPLPRLLYNLGQLLRRIGEYKEAAEAYELYLRTEAELAPERKQEVERYLTALRTETQVAARAPTLISDSERSSKAGADEPILLTLPPAAEAKAGRFMFNVALGLSFPIFIANLTNNNLSNALPLGFTVRPDFGVAVTGNRNGYLIFSPSFTLGSSYSLMFPVGFQYDIPVVVRGLFFFFRATAGYGLSIKKENMTTTTGTVETTSIVHYGAVEPEAGIKYVLAKRVNLIFEPVAVPIFFNDGVIAGGYRLLFSAGYNF